MIKNDIIYNKNCLVIIPIGYKHLLEEMEYSFENVMIFNNLEKVTEQFNVIKNSNYKQIIFVNYLVEYNEIVKKLKNISKIKFIFTGLLGEFSNVAVYYELKAIISLYNDKLVDKIGFYDINLYNTFKDKIDCCHLRANIKREEKIKEYSKNEVGLLNSQYKPVHSFYNELSALKFNDYTGVFDSISEQTKKFVDTFDIKYSVKYQLNNLVNLYVNFTGNDNTVFLKSMDLGVPCIIGNNELLNSSRLKDYLYVESDDSIDEIASKIEIAKNNRDKIIKEYDNYRREYDNKWEKEREEFLDTKIVNYEVPSKEELLLSIVVPVYNTEKYLEECLKSILVAIPNEIKDKTEILIINDGSKDNSETIIKEYEKKYPKLIRYIYQENKGLGNVRNVALKEVKGKYIASIDSDDKIDKDFFNSCLNDLKDNVDVVIFNWLSITDKGNFETSAIEWCFKDINKYEGILYSSIMPSTCNKIIKKALYDKLNITFLEDKYEDLSTNPFILLEASVIKYINKPYYHYYIRSNSIMRSSAGLSMINVVKEVDKRIKKYGDYININLNKFKYYTLSWRIEEFILNQLYTLEKDELDKFIKYIYDNAYDIIKEVFENKYYISMVNKLNKEHREYINNRNEAFVNKRIKEFIRDNKEVFKLNAPIIYFGE